MIARGRGRGKWKVIVNLLHSFNFQDKVLLETDGGVDCITMRMY